MHGWFANVWRLGRKELAGLAADKVLATFIVYSFSFSVYSVAAGVRTEVERAPMAIVDGDRSALSARIVDAMLPPEFRTPGMIDRSQVDPRMDRGAYSFVLDLPPGMEADLLRGQAPLVQLNIDATAMTHAGVGAGYVTAILHQEARAFMQARSTDAGQPVVPVIRARFNPNLTGQWFHAVKAVLENITMLSMLLAGAAVIREREHGTLEHLLVMPVRASEVAVAKIWASSTVILVAGGLSLVLVVNLLLDVPIAGSVPLFLAGTAIYLFATTSLGILLATVARSMPQFALLAMPVFLVLNMLSGAFTPLESAPAGLRTLLLASPTVHYIRFAQAVLYRGADITMVWPQLLVLAGLGAAFLAAALARFRAMLASIQ
jgi:ABC-2 type transport system permease protein